MVNANDPMLLDLHLLWKKLLLEPQQLRYISENGYNDKIDGNILILIIIMNKNKKPVRKTKLVVNSHASSSVSLY